MAKRARDGQQKKMWKCTWKLNETLDKDEGTLTAYAIEAQIDLIIGAPVLQGLFPWIKGKKVQFLCRGQTRSGDTRFTLPTRCRQTQYVLHRLAQAIVMLNKAWATEPYNGWRMAEIYLEVTRYVRGKKAQDLLKSAYKENKVRYKDPERPTKRKGNPEALAAWREKQKGTQEEQRAKLDEAMRWLDEDV